MPRFAVPVIVLVEAKDIDHAYYKVADTLSPHAFPGDRMPCLLDESLDAFQYDPDTVEVHTALDYPANVSKARSYK